MYWPTDQLQQLVKYKQPFYSTQSVVFFACKAHATDGIKGGCDAVAFKAIFHAVLKLLEIIWHMTRFFPHSNL